MSRQPAGLYPPWILREQNISDRFLRARRASDPGAILPPSTRRKDRPSKPGGLTKQTYSATVNLPGSPEPRKWHLVAYFSVRMRQI